MPEISQVHILNTPAPSTSGTRKGAAHLWLADLLSFAERNDTTCGPATAAQETCFFGGPCGAVFVARNPAKTETTSGRQWLQELTIYKFRAPEIVKSWRQYEQDDRKHHPGSPWLGEFARVGAL